MKKFIAPVLALVVIIGAFLALYIHSDYSFSFIDTYKKNFSQNVKNIKLHYELKKAQAEENRKNKDTKEDTEDDDTITDEPIAEDEENEIVGVKFDEQKLTKKFVQSGDPIAIPPSSNAEFGKYQDGILYVNETSLVYYDKDSKVKWTNQIQVSNPILKVNGTYILIMEKGGTRVYLFNGKKQVYVTDTTEKILTGNLSSQGDCAIVTEKKYYKGAVVVLNTSGQEIFARSFGTSSIISAAISDSRRLCVSLLTVEETANSKIMFLDLDKTKEDVVVEYKDSIVFDLEFSNTNLYAYADDKLIALSNKGKQMWNFSYNQKTLNKYCDDNHNVRLLMFDNNNNAELSVISASGKEKQKIKTDMIPDFCDIQDGYVLYNGGRSLYVSKLNQEAVAKYVTSRDMKSAYFLDSDNILIVYNQSIEFLKLQRGE